MSTTRRDLLVGSAIAIWAMGTATLAVLRHYGLQTQMNDLGNAEQALWSFLQGDWGMTQTNTPDLIPRPRLAIHINLLLYPMALLYRWAPHPELLQLLPAAASGTTAALLYREARGTLGVWAPVVPLSFLASPPVQDAAVFDYHATNLLATNEDGALLAGGLAISYLLTGRRRLGGAILAAGVVWTCIWMLGVVPRINDGHSMEKLASGGARYRWLGATPGEALETLLTRPDVWSPVVLDPVRARIVVYLGVLGIGWAWSGWRWLPAALPPIVLALLSQATFVTRISGTYYYVITEAVVGIALVEGAGRLGLIGRSSAVLVATALFSPYPYGWRMSMENYRVATQLGAVEEAATQLGPEGMLCVKSNLGPHVSKRRQVATLTPDCMATHPAWVLLSTEWTAGPDGGISLHTSPWYVYYSNHPERRARELVRGEVDGLRPVWTRDGVWLFSADPAAAPLADAEDRMEAEIGPWKERLASVVQPEPRWLTFLNSDGSP